jgi:hypothetical protein
VPHLLGAAKELLVAGEVGGGFENFVGARCSVGFSVEGRYTAHRLPGHQP